MDLTRQLRGKQVVAVLTNGNVLSIRMADGAEVNVKWVDEHGMTLKGRPVVESRGWRMRAHFRDIIYGKEVGL